MSFVLTLVLLGLATALVAAAGVAIPRPGGRRSVTEYPVDGGVESPLLRRPLRSRHQA